MFKNSYPIFKSGNVINKKMLDSLRDNPMEILEIMYIDYNDGILKGFDLITKKEEKKIIITRGIAKIEKKLMWMYQDYEIEMPKIEKNYILKLKLNTVIERYKFYERVGEFIIEEGNRVNKNEIEITRFITREGEELRNDYRNFFDLKRDFNLLEIINTKYSSKHIIGTLHPKVLKFWGIEAIEKLNLEYIDIIFAKMCIQGNLIERDVIISYINSKLKKTKKEYSNYELYSELLKILNLFSAKEIEKEKEWKKPEKIVID